MKQCQIYNNSLRFSRATYGTLLLIAFFIHSQWLVLAVAVLTVLGALSLKLNIPYQIHVLIFKRKSELISKESGELNFVAGATGLLLFIGWLFLYFGKFVNFAWIYILVVTMMIFLACFIGFCVATLMYVFLKRLFNKTSV
ncbi:MAG: DUF4395 family protein [Candidatus Komeilibacteria bacterium]|nr:DUF4395 family protein [Candidatus Komeilibacteria bacterium]